MGAARRNWAQTKADWRWWRIAERPRFLARLAELEDDAVAAGRSFQASIIRVAGPCM